MCIYIYIYIYIYITNLRPVGTPCGSVTERTRPTSKDLLRGEFNWLPVAVSFPTRMGVLS